MHIAALSGGVSCDLHLVQAADRAFVVKQALPKLRVDADWYADVARNEIEQAFISYVRRWLPDHLPEIFFADPEVGLFIMEYLGAGFVNWKEKLLNGRVNPADTRTAARLLGVIHRRSWDDPFARQHFDTGRNFYELRLEPYLLATAGKHPTIRELMVTELDRLGQTRQCLVHGDYSPKNILIGAERTVILDCEVAWFGDPVFDLAFCLNHFLLKSLHLVPAHQPFIQQIPIFRDQYRETLGSHYEEQQLESRLVHLLPMLLLARVDGKSPVEYLTQEHKRTLIREFAYQALSQTTDRLEVLLLQWKKALGAMA